MPIQAFHMSIMSPILDWFRKQTDQPFHMYGWARPQQKPCWPVCVWAGQAPVEALLTCERILFGANMSTSKEPMWIWSHRHGLSKKMQSWPHSSSKPPLVVATVWSIVMSYVWISRGEPWQIQINEQLSCPITVLYKGPLSHLKYRSCQIRFGDAVVATCNNTSDQLELTVAAALAKLLTIEHFTKPQNNTDGKCMYDSWCVYVSIYSQCFNIRV